MMTWDESSNFHFSYARIIIAKLSRFEATRRLHFDRSDGDVAFGYFHTFAIDAGNSCIFIWLSQ